MCSNLFRKEDTIIKELLDNIEKLRVEFEAIERPTLELETPDNDAENAVNKAETLSNEEEILSSENVEVNHPETTEVAKSPKSKKNKHPDSPSTKSEQVLDTEAELAKLESEFGKFNTADEIGDWEFDELERELRSGETTSSK